MVASPEPSVPQEVGETVRPGVELAVVEAGTRGRHDDGDAIGVTFGDDTGVHGRHGTVGSVHTQFGEGSAGSGPEAAYTTTVLGRRDGPVEAAWAAALSSPSSGFPRIVVNVRPGMPVLPMTLMVPKLSVGDTRLLLGAAQAGVAEAVVACVADGVIDPYDAPRTLLLVAVWLDPTAGDEDVVFDNQRAAARSALRAGAKGGRPVAEVIEAASSGAWNLFFRDRS